MGWKDALQALKEATEVLKDLEAKESENGGITEAAVAKDPVNFFGKVTIQSTCCVHLPAFFLFQAVLCISVDMETWYGNEACFSYTVGARLQPSPGARALDFARTGAC